jgi:hypothetical protein
VGRDTFARLPGNKRGEYDEDDDDENTSERMVASGGQVSPLVFDREMAARPSRVLQRCAGAAAPFFSEQY